MRSRVAAGNGERKYGLPCGVRVRRGERHHIRLVESMALKKEPVESHEYPYHKEFSQSGNFASPSVMLIEDDSPAHME